MAFKQYEIGVSACLGYWPGRIMGGYCGVVYMDGEIRRYVAGRTEADIKHAAEAYVAGEFDALYEFMEAAR